ncbi:MAG: hypothetical protein ACKVP7_22210 [Hyphomicrobiaceae bacterium]
MIETTRDNATRDEDMKIVIVRPERVAHPVIFFLMDAPANARSLTRPPPSGIGNA